MVCALGETIASYSPINAFSKVLLPALGIPKMFANPDFIYFCENKSLNIKLDEYKGKDKNIIDSVIKNGEIIVSLTDYGIGIPGESIDKIFNRLYRMDEPAI